MQRVLCEEHGSLCFLKTGMRDGPNKGKSFYVCGAGPSAPCKFTQHSDVPASHCLLHEEFLVELQMLVPQESRGHRLFYRCTKGKSDGKKWCGNVPWQELKNKAVLSNVISQSHMGREEAARNPFKVIDGPKPTLWKQISEEKKCNSEEWKLGENTSEERKTVEQRKHNSEENTTVELRKHDSEERKTVEQRKHNSEENTTVELRKHDSEERKTVEQRKHDSEERKTLEQRKHDSKERKTVEQRKHDSEERKTLEQRKHNSEENTTVELRKHDSEERKTVEQRKHDSEERKTLEQRKHDSKERKTVEQRKHDSEERKTLEQRKHDSEERKTLEQRKHDSEERKTVEQRKHDREERKTLEQRKHDSEERKTQEQRKHDSEERKTVEQRKHDSEQRKTVEQRKHDSEERKTVEQRKHNSEERKTVEQRKHNSEERKTLEQRKHNSEERKTLEQRKHDSEERRTVLREHNREERKTVEERQQNSKERTSVDQNKHNREERKFLEQRKHDSEARKNVEERKHNSEERKHVEQRKHDSEARKTVEERKHDSEERKTVEERKHDSEERKFVEQRKHDSEERKTVEQRKHDSEERKFVEQRKHDSEERKTVEQRKHDSEERKFVEQRKHNSEERKQRKCNSEDTRTSVLTNNEEKTQNTEDKNITKEKIITEKSSIEKTCMTFAGKDCRDVLWSHGDNHGVQISGEESYSFQGWREKALPTGMKIKKKSLERVAEKPSVTAEIDRGHADRIPEKSNKTRNEQSSDNCNLGEPKRTTDDDVKEQTEGVDNEVMSPRHIKDSQRPKINYDGHSKSKALQCQDDDENEDVVFVCSQPGMDKLPLARSSGAGKQRTIPSFPGFSTQTETLSSAALHSQLTVQLQQKKATLASVNLQALPDRGERLLKQVQDLEDALGSMTLSTDTNAESCEASSEVVTTRHQTNPVNPFSKSISEEPAWGVKHLAFHELPTSTMGLHGSGKTLSSSQNYSSLYGVAPHPGLYGGRMTEDRLFAVRNATSEAIDHLHKSLESCPSPESTIEDPPGLKVPLLLHQKQALAWLLWRETQRPQGGILADDMGLGKTLTMLAVILLQKQRQKEKADEKKLEAWISKNDSTLTVSRGTLIICPASLIHHWKKEVEKRVSGGRLQVYLYHGPNREKDCRVLAQYDIVVTTYSLLSKEIPVKKEEAESVAKDQDLEDKGACASPLLRLAWSRIILDEAHNIKNPKVQTSLAVCKLRASARWAVTGTPIQNNLLDMYSLLRFLRCSPFDEFKLWKNQVDNGSKKGGERLNILTKSLLLRRTKDQLDHTGKPLVALPQRRSEVHRLTLSEQEQAVYDVIFARSRSTLQSYLKRHEGGAQVPARNGDNPFERVAREFGASQPEFPASQSPQGSSTVHILSLLLRLRQCCCHLSLLKVTLDQLELRSEGLSLSLEEQLNALTLCELQSQEPKSQVSLNGTRFPSELFETNGQSTKISSLLCHLRTISSSSETQKSVIVSQWTSMLRIVALHLKRIGLSYVTIDGSVNPKQRMDLVEEFNNTPRDPQVMLVSLCAGGVGLNLIGGNHLFLLDMHWNPALEDQACDRIYRVGQRKDVVIHRFVCLGTVEEKISQLQDKKKDLAKKVLSGTSATFTKLTLADLRLLFGV